jgi:hypothetical protein
VASEDTPTALLIQLAVRGSGTRLVTEVDYDEHLQMSRIAGSRTMAIDYEGPAPPRTKKFDVEKGEDQKDRW